MGVGEFFTCRKMCWAKYNLEGSNVASLIKALWFKIEGIECTLRRLWAAGGLP